VAKVYFSSDLSTGDASGTTLVCENMLSCCGCRLNSLERRDLQASIRNQKERNMVLSRLNNELNQELQEVMEQRIALEIQMEHLQPYHS